MLAPHGRLAGVRLLALDLDGTLLDPTGSLTVRSTSALRAAHDAGTVVVLASGRPPFMAAPVIDVLADVVTHGVMANGSIVCTFPDGAPLREIHFSIELAVDTVQLLRGHDSSFGFALATNAGFAQEPGFSERMPATAFAPVSADVLEAAVGAQAARKLMVFHRTTPAHRLLETLPALLHPSLNVSHMGADAVEIGPAGIDKATGLQWLCEHLGIDRADVVAIGDEYNDHEMLRWAGHGIAMGNADEVTKSLADSVTLSNADDGVAVAVELLLAR